MNFHDKLKNKNWKIDFSFVSAHSAPYMKTGSKLRSDYIQNPSDYIQFLFEIRFEFNKKRDYLK